MYQGRIFAEPVAPVSPVTPIDSAFKNSDNVEVTGFKRLLTSARRPTSVKKGDSLQSPSIQTPKLKNPETYHLDGFFGGAVSLKAVVGGEDDEDEDSDED